MTLDQVYDELYGEIDQIKNELKNTLAQIQYASTFTEGIPLGTLSVGSESSQVIAPHVSLLPGAESGMMVLDLPVGTESAMLPVQIQDDPEATELVSDALPTGKTVENVLNSNFVKYGTSKYYGVEIFGNGTNVLNIRCYTNAAKTEYVALTCINNQLKFSKYFADETEAVYFTK